MPKYTVDEVVEIINSLSAEEIVILRDKAVKLFENGSKAQISNDQMQSQSFGNVSIQGSANSMTVSQGGLDSEVSRQEKQVSMQNPELKEVVILLGKLREDILSSRDLNRLEKETARVSVNILEEEIEKDSLDKTFIDHTVESLHKGLKGVQSLAEPVMKVSSLIAKAWMVI